MKNPIVFFLLVLFTVVNVADLITTWYIIGAEANPIYHFMIQYVTSTYAFLGIVLIKAVFVGLTWVMYGFNAFSSKYQYFTFILIIVLALFAVGLAAYNNLVAMLHPAQLAAAASVPPAERVKVYRSFMLIIYVIPLTLCLLSYKLHEWGLKYARVK